VYAELFTAYTDQSGQLNGHHDAGAAILPTPPDCEKSTR
jgi:hypothetical protein